MEHYEVLYIGENVNISKKNSIPYLSGKRALTKNTKYKLQFPLTEKTAINGWCVLYFYDDINDGQSRGYEVRVEDIKPINEVREDKLNKLLNNGSYIL